MTQLTIDDPLFQKLQSVHEPIAFRNAQGNVVGHFVPAIQPEGDARVPKISAAEMDTRESRGGGRPLSEILADLGKKT